MKRIGTSSGRTVVMFGISAAAFLGPFTQTIYVPSLVEVGNYLQANTILVNLTISIYTAILAVSSFVVGPLADSRGRRAILIPGLLLFVAGSLLCFFAPSYWMFLGGRVLQAVGISTGSVVAAAVVGDIYPPAERPHAMSNYQLIVFLGPVFGPVIGGLIAAYLHWWWAFGVLVAGGVAIAAYNARYLPETLDKSGPATSLHLAGVKSVLRSRSAQSLLLVGFSQFYGYYVFLVFLPVLGQQFGLSVAQKGFSFVPLTAGILAGMLAAKRWLGHWPRTRMLKVASYAIAASVFLLCLLLAAGRLSISVLAMVTLLYGALMGASLPAQSTILVNLFNAERATAMGVYNFTRFMGAAAGPLLGAVIAQAFGVLAMLGSLGGLLLLSAWTIHRRAHDPYEQAASSNAPGRSRQT